MKVWIAQNECGSMSAFSVKPELYQTELGKVWAIPKNGNGIAFRLTSFDPVRELDEFGNVRYLNWPDLLGFKPYIGKHAITSYKDLPKPCKEPVECELTLTVVKK